MVETMKFFTMWLCVVGSLSPPSGSDSYTGTEARSPLHEDAGNRLTEKLTRQDATDPKQKAVTDYYKEQVDRPPPPIHRESKNRRTNTTTKDITTRSPISEQRSQETPR